MLDSSTSWPLNRLQLDVVIQAKLVRVRAHPYGIRFVLLLVVDPEFNVVLGEDSAFGHELVIRNL